MTKPVTDNHSRPETSFGRETDLTSKYSLPRECAALPGRNCSKRARLPLAGSASG